MTDNQLPPLPTPKFTETIRGVPCITVTEHEHLMRTYALQAIALRPAAVPMTGEQWTDVLESAGPDLLDLAKQWSDNEVHVYQFVNEAEKIVKSAVLRGITAQAKKETP